MRFNIDFLVSGRVEIEADSIEQAIDTFHALDSEYLVCNDDAETESPVAVVMYELDEDDSESLVRPKCPHCGSRESNRTKEQLDIFNISHTCIACGRYFEPGYRIEVLDV
jgi:DNA-directed RNA polymerase subunit RPC12/RpoP